MTIAIVLSAVVVAAVAVPSQTPASQVKREEFTGIRNFSTVGPTVACAGATDAAAIPEIAKRGYKTMINLRLESEPDANVPAAKAAAAKAGINYIHLPFEVARPDESIVDRFIAAVSDPANQPVFIHCGSANRVGALWMIKRAVADNWDNARAEAEAREIGLSNPTLRDFALAQIARRRK